MERRWILLATSALFLAGLWLLLGPGREAGAPHAPASGQVPPHDPPSELVPAHRSAPETEDGSRVELDVAATENPATLITIRVVAETTGQPVPGAEVLHVDRALMGELSEPERREFEAYGPDIDARLERFGEIVVADDNGMVRLPLREYLHVTGKSMAPDGSGPLYGRASFPLDPEPPAMDREHDLVLQQDFTLTVQVLDHNGDPAPGVPLLKDPVWPREEDRSFRIAPFAESDEEGKAVFPHFQRQIQYRDPAIAGYVIRPHIPGILEGGVPLDRRDPPGETVILQLPPTGSVVVRAHDGAGGPLTPHSAARMAFPPEEEQVTGSRYSPPAHLTWRGKLEPGGITRFPYVAVGRDYWTEVDAGPLRLERTFTGPVLPDQEVTVDLALDPELPVLVGRVLDGALEPLRSTELWIEHADGPDQGSSQPVVTDEHGVFRAVLRAEAEGRTLRGVIERYQERLWPDPSFAGPVPVHAFRTTLHPGPNHLGDVVLRPGHLVAAGRVFMDGEPATGSSANLRIERSPPGAEPRWREIGGLSLTQSFLVGGRFEVRGIVPEGRYRLALRGTGHLPVPPFEFTPGQEDLELHLSRGGSLRATVLTEEDLDTGRFSLQLEPSSGPPLEEPQRPDPMLGRIILRDGEVTGVEWNALRPGTYDLTVRTARGREPIAMIGAVLVRSGEATQPVEIDLRGRLRKLRVQVLDPSGQPIQNADRERCLVFVDPGSAAEAAVMAGFSPTDGAVELVVGREPVNLLVTAPGHLPRRIDGVREDLTVRLEPLPKLPIHVSTPPLPPGFSLGVRLTPIGLSDRRTYRSERRGGGMASLLFPPSSTTPLDGQGACLVPVAPDATYRARVYLRGNDRSVLIPRTTPAEIVVPETLELRIYLLEVTAEGLRQALERIGS